jgi:endonuclease/exonuclease/phosphatase family metal-dependent hydrolase
VSWNVHVGGGDIDRFVSDLRDGRLTQGRIPAGFVLLLQEAVRSEGVPDVLPAAARAAGWIGDGDRDAIRIEQAARRQRLSLFYAPSMRNGASTDRHPPSDRGNAVLSTAPLSDPQAIELPGDGQRRVALTATAHFTVDGRVVPIAVGAAHLSTKGPPSTLWVFGAAGLRRVQARSLAGALPDTPMVLGADLNTWLAGPDEPAARDLLRLFPATPRGRREPTAAGGLVLDYLFFRPPVGWQGRLTRAPERYGSDHYPLIGWIERVS